MFTNKELVKNIRELAKKNGTSLTKIEKKLGWGNGKIGKWESAKKLPPKQDLELVANELKISVKTITGQKEIPPTEKADGTMPPKEYANLTAANKAIVDRLIADLVKSQLDNPPSDDSLE